MTSPALTSAGTLIDMLKGRLLAMTLSSRPARPCPTPSLKTRNEVTASEAGNEDRGMARGVRPDRRGPEDRLRENPCEPAPTHPSRRGPERPGRAPAACHRAGPLVGHALVCRRGRRGFCVASRARRPKATAPIGCATALAAGPGAAFLAGALRSPCASASGSITRAAAFFAWARRAPATAARRANLWDDGHGPHDRRRGTAAVTRGPAWR